MGVAGELLVAAVDVPAFEEQLGAVAEGVLDRVGVEVLVDVVAAVVPAAGALGLDRPGVLHPAAFVDVVDQEVAEAAAAGPEEPVELWIWYSSSLMPSGLGSVSAEPTGPVWR